MAFTFSIALLLLVLHLGDVLGARRRQEEVHGSGTSFVKFPDDSFSEEEVDPCEGEEEEEEEDEGMAGPFGQRGFAIGGGGNASSRRALGQEGLQGGSSSWSSNSMREGGRSGGGLKGGSSSWSSDSMREGLKGGSSSWSSGSMREGRRSSGSVKGGQSYGTDDEDDDEGQRIRGASSRSTSSGRGSRREGRRSSESVRGGQSYGTEDDEDDDEGLKGGSSSWSSGSMREGSRSSGSVKGGQSYGTDDEDDDEGQRIRGASSRSTSSGRGSRREGRRSSESVRGGQSYGTEDDEDDDEGLKGGSSSWSSGSMREGSRSSGSVKGGQSYGTEDDEDDDEGESIRGGSSRSASSGRGSVREGRRSSESVRGGTSYGTEEDDEDDDEGFSSRADYGDEDEGQSGRATGSQKRSATSGNIGPIGTTPFVPGGGAYHHSSTSSSQHHYSHSSYSSHHSSHQVTSGGSSEFNEAMTRARRRAEGDGSLGKFSSSQHHSSKQGSSPANSPGSFGADSSEDLFALEGGGGRGSSSRSSRGGGASARSLSLSSSSSEGGGSATTSRSVSVGSSSSGSGSEKDATTDMSYYWVYLYTNKLREDPFFAVAYAPPTCELLEKEFQKAKKAFLKQEQQGNSDRIKFQFYNGRSKLEYRLVRPTGRSDDTMNDGFLLIEETAGEFRPVLRVPKEKGKSIIGSNVYLGAVEWKGINRNLLLPVPSVELYHREVTVDWRRYYKWIYFERKGDELEGTCYAPDVAKELDAKVARLTYEKKTGKIHVGDRRDGHWFLYELAGEGIRITETRNGQLLPVLLVELKDYKTRVTDKEFLAEGVYLAEDQEVDRIVAAPPGSLGTLRVTSCSEQKSRPRSSSSSNRSSQSSGRRGSKSS
eukprot:TRINITY_DN2152_c0_g1_i8.p1 TRINITY_DN2152_c0_g1~~TRINITY_DN2152_c0_g1_i8.p1  ORF type:complete len:901 (-),score=141.26 TRINITY_DN2152_c0_g1_i8:240-2870(-)